MKIIYIIVILVISAHGSYAAAQKAGDPLKEAIQSKFGITDDNIDPKILAPENRELWTQVTSQIQFPAQLTSLSNRPFPAKEMRLHLADVFVGRVPPPAALYIARLSSQSANETAVKSFLESAEALVLQNDPELVVRYNQLVLKACAMVSAAEFESATVESSGARIHVVRVGEACLPVYLGSVRHSEASIGLSFLEAKASRLVLRGEKHWSKGSQMARCEVAPPLLSSKSFAPGGEVIIAIIDSGIDYNHPALAKSMTRGEKDLPSAHQLIRQRLAALPKSSKHRLRQSLQRVDAQPEHMMGLGWDFLQNTNFPMDYFVNEANSQGWMQIGGGHGSHVAGLARGDCQQCGRLKLLPLRMIGQSDVFKNGMKQEKNSYEIAYDAVSLANLRRARVANISMDGQGERGQGFVDAILDHPNLLLTLSAGNTGSEINEFSIPLQKLQAANIIRVAAFDPATRGISHESAFGAEYVDVAEHGVSVQSCTVGGSVGRKSGTSMAAPRVANLAALIVSLKPEITPQEVKELICKTADPLPLLQGKVRCGLVNPEKALSTLLGVADLKP